MHIITEAWRIITLTAISWSAKCVISVDHVSSSDDYALKLTDNEKNE
jgi:hypothetical protein